MRLNAWAQDKIGAFAAILSTDFSRHLEAMICSNRNLSQPCNLSPGRSRSRKASCTSFTSQEAPNASEQGHMTFG